MKWSTVPDTWNDIAHGGGSVTKYLLENSAGDVLTYIEGILTNTELVQPLTRENFDEFGFKELDYIPSILSLTGMKLLLDSRGSLVVEAIPKAQLILPSKDINFKMLEFILGINLHFNESLQGKIRVIVDFGGKDIWRTYNKNTLSFEVIDIENLVEIAQDGMDVNTLNSISEEVWKSQDAKGKIKFGYYLEIDGLEDIAEVDQLDVVFELEGKWKSAEQGTDFNYGYGNEVVNVRLYKDGRYKINYN